MILLGGGHSIEMRLVLQCYKSNSPLAHGRQERVFDFVTLQYVTHLEENTPGQRSSRF